MNPKPERKTSILFVDDDVAISAAMTRYLQASGFETRMAPNAAAALEMLQDALPDVIVTDIYMGGSDGFELIEAVRAERPNLPIIAISGGRADFDALAQAAKLGANATIEKPFSAAYLVDTIDRCLDVQKPVGRMRG
jgi:DNA-binding NtrC family response regulator